MSANLTLVLRRPMYGKGLSVAYTGTAGTTGVLPQQANSVMLWCTTAAWVALVGTSSGVATTADVPIPANTPIILPVERPTSPGTDPNIWVSAVQVAAGGTLYVVALSD